MPKMKKDYLFYQSNYFMRILILWILSALLLSCNTRKTKARSNDIDRAKNSIADTFVIKNDMNTLLACDTTITYDIEEISSEGTEAIACYHGKKLYQCTVSVFGAGGRTDLQFDFDDSAVKVKEYSYQYTKPLAEISSDKEIWLSDSLFYVLDKMNGKIIKGEIGNDKKQFYLAIIKKVPLSL